jgi:hypothetical protein
VHGRHRHAAAACNGAGSCPAVQTQTCAPFTCGAVACQGNCTADTDCTSGDFCAAGVCTPKKAPGGSCSATDQCGSGFCVDGLCCDTSCDGQCQACNVAGKAGTCSPVAGDPVGGRASCNSDGSACGGTCDGTHGNACSYPGSDTSCSSCVAGACIVTSPSDIALAGTSGCSSGGGSIAPILGLVMFALFRMRKRKGVAVAAVLAVAGASPAQSVSTNSNLVVDANQPLRVITAGTANNPQQQFSVLRYQSMLYLGASMSFAGRLELVTSESGAKKKSATNDRTAGDSAGTPPASKR